MFVDTTITQAKCRVRWTRIVVVMALTAPARKSARTSTLSTATPTRADWAMLVSVMLFECMLRTMEQFG